LSRGRLRPRHDNLEELKDFAAKMYTSFFVQPKICNYNDKVQFTLLSINTVPSNKFGIRVSCDLYFCLVIVRLLSTDSCQINSNYKSCEAFIHNFHYLFIIIRWNYHTKFFLKIIFEVVG
jgi:hypothetical protein